MPRTRCLWSLRAGVRSAVTAEASRRDTTPSELVARFFAERFPDFVADSVRRTIRASLDDRDPDGRAPGGKLARYEPADGPCRLAPVGGGPEGEAA
jgi:hypothetical protein